MEKKRKNISDDNKSDNTLINMYDEDDLEEEMDLNYLYEHDMITYEQARELGGWND